MDELIIKQVKLRKLSYRMNKIMCLFVNYLSVIFFARSTMSPRSV